VQLPPGDLDPVTGRARLSYRRAAELFEQATAVCRGGPWTLHQLHHRALTHAAEAETAMGSSNAQNADSVRQTATLGQLR
jgi:hypothetical protein